MTIAEKLAGLRRKMDEKKIQTYIIGTADAHQSEYVAPYWKARAYMSGFTGSAGTLVVTQDKAACWVDGRYFLQGEEQLKGTEIAMMKIGEEGVPTYQDWAISETPEGGTIGVDGRTVGCAWVEDISPKLEPKKLQLCCREDLVGAVWTDRPNLPDNPIFELPEVFAGESRKDKLARLREHMKEVDAQYYLIASLEGAAWLLNYRGSDIMGTPVAYGYVLVGLTEAELFMDAAKVPQELAAALAQDGVTVKPYDSLPERLAVLEGALACDPNLINQLLMESIGCRVIKEADAIHAMQAVKNETERTNVRAAHVKDGAVMAQFIKWVKESAAPAGLTEVQVASYLDDLRGRQENSLGISFTTIAGYGANGAIVHYGPEEGKCALLKPEGLLLVDSGAQYLEGTTDITRTIAVGPVTDAMKRAYTLVLKGHLALGHAVFREGTTGANLDILARGPLWKAGLDYKHGTGHGVGYVLGVHEGPQGIGLAQTVKLVPGMVISNEPGYYEAGAFGVRIENLVMVAEREKTEWGQFYEMETLTLCPYEREAIDKSLLTAEEVQQIDAYHERVYSEVAPLLDAETKVFLYQVTRPL